MKLHLDTLAYLEWKLREAKQLLDKQERELEAAQLVVRRNELRVKSQREVVQDLHALITAGVG